MCGVESGAESSGDHDHRGRSYGENFVTWFNALYLRSVRQERQQVCSYNVRKQWEAADGAS